MAGTEGSPAGQHQELLGVLRHLVGDRDSRGVIRLVERWAEAGDLPREARLEEARAFLDLRLMDRAWVRLKELTEHNPDDDEALLLTASLYVERGWPGRAKKVVERLRARGSSVPGLDAVAARAALPPLEPPADAREIERVGSPAQLLALAEILLSTGSFGRARGLLDKVRRMEPTNLRAALLLWGVQGEFVRRGESLGALLQELLPPSPEDWDTGEQTDVRGLDLGLGDAPTTEVEAVLEDADAEPAFPSLFRRRSGPGETLEPDDTDDEPTMASVLAPAAAPSEGHEGTDPGVEPAATAGDTQIMAIIPGPGRPTLAPVDGPAHRRVGEKASPVLDLRAWQSSMGVGDSQIPLDRADDKSEDFLEDEDQDLVVMTRREHPPEAVPDEVPEGERKPIEVVERFPTPGAPPPAPAAAPRPAEPPPSLPPPPPAPRRGNGSQVAVVLVVTAVLVALGGGVLLRVVLDISGRRLLDQTHAALATGQADEVSSLLRRLEPSSNAGTPPRGHRLVSVALLRIEQWSEYTGDPEQLALAREELERSTSYGAPAHEVALAQALIALGEGDAAAAQRWAAQANMTRPDVRMVAAEAALALGDLPAALALGPPVGGGLREDLTWARVLAQSEDAAALSAARDRLIAAHGDDPLVFLTRVEERWDALPPEGRLGALDAWLMRHPALPARLRARAQLLSADLLSQLGEDEDSAAAVQLALEADPRYPGALYRRASLAVAAADFDVAYADLRVCLEARPLDWDCRRGMVQALLDDRGPDAAREVLARRPDPLRDPVLQAWISLSSGEPDAALRLLPEAAPTAPRLAGLSWYIRGSALGQLGRPEAEAELARAGAVLVPSTDPLDRVLAARSLASRDVLGGTPGAGH